MDVHHDKVSVADMEEGHITKLEDLRVICANCHRSVHGLKTTVNRLIELNKKLWLYWKCLKPLGALREMKSLSC